MLSKVFYDEDYLRRVSPCILLLWWSWWPPSWGPVAPAPALCRLRLLFPTVRTQTPTSDEPQVRPEPWETEETDSSHYAEWWRGPALPANPGCQPTNTDKQGEQWQTSQVTRAGERWKFAQFHNFLHSLDENKVKLFAENELCSFLIKS